MNELTSEDGRKDPRGGLSTLWIFLTLNYVFCDVVGFMDAAMLRQYLDGAVNGLRMSEAVLLSGTILMEVPMLMIVCSRFLPARIGLPASFAAGVFMTIVQAASLFVGAPRSYYAFFSAIEIAASAGIAIYSFTAIAKARRVRAGEKR